MDRETAVAARCENCQLEAPVVGWGTPPTWLCQDCFDASLAVVGKVLRQLRARRN